MWVNLIPFCLLLTATCAQRGKTPAQTNIKLEGGPTPYEGVAMFRNEKGEWGTICDKVFFISGWGQVFCKELGYERAIVKVFASTKGITMSGPITYHGPNCNLQNARTMEECGKDKGECEHRDDVYIKCAGKLPPNQATAQSTNSLQSNQESSQGQSQGGSAVQSAQESAGKSQIQVNIRLEGGKNDSEGIAMFQNEKGEWGTICDKAFNINGWGQVFCRELGYARAVEKVKASTKGLQKSGLVAFPGPNCNVRNANSMSECGKDTGTCGHEDDIYIRCEGGGEGMFVTGSDPPGPVQLTDGVRPGEGRAMVKDKAGRFGPICHKAVSKDDWPKLFCQELGYSDSAEVRTTHSAGLSPLSDAMSLQTPICPSGTHTITDCKSGTPCTDAEAVWIKCQGQGSMVVEKDEDWKGADGQHIAEKEPAGDPGQDETRYITETNPAGPYLLEEGKALGEGRMMYKVNDKYGPICAPVDRLEAWHQHFCIEMGFGRALEAKFVVNADTKPSSADHAVKSPKCPKHASAFSDCIGKNPVDCGHDKDMWVKCGGDPPPVLVPVVHETLNDSEAEDGDAEYDGIDGNVTLFGGEAPNEGIAMYRDEKGEWGTICDKAFNINGWGQVFCTELGYDRAVEKVKASKKDLSKSGPIGFQGPNCNLQNAESMSECGKDKGTCDHNDDVYIKCEDDAVPEEETVGDIWDDEVEEDTWDDEDDIWDDEDEDDSQDHGNNGVPKYIDTWPTTRPPGFPTEYPKEWPKTKPEDWPPGWSLGFDNKPNGDVDWKACRKQMKKWKQVLCPHDPGSHGHPETDPSEASSKGKENTGAESNDSSVSKTTEEPSGNSIPTAKPSDGSGEDELIPDADSAALDVAIQRQTCFRGHAVNRLARDHNQGLTIYPGMRFLCAGQVNAWAIHATEKGNIVVGIWRPFTKGKFRLTGKNLLNIRKPGKQIVRNSRHQRLRAGPDDVIGIHYLKKENSGIITVVTSDDVTQDRYMKLGYDEDHLFPVLEYDDNNDKLPVGTIREYDRKQLTKKRQVPSIVPILQKDVARLEGGRTPDEGSAMYYRGTTWGTITDTAPLTNTGWPNVFCRSKGYHHAGEAKLARDSYTGVGHGTITSSNPFCSSHLVADFDNCAGRRPRLTSHRQDVFIRCEDEVALIGGSDASEGQAFMYKDGKWGSVCDNNPQPNWTHA